MTKTVLMCPPDFFDVKEVKNAYMGSPIDRAKALQQWGGLRQALVDSGVTVETIAPVRDLEDMVFSANQVFVGKHPRIGKFIVPSRMRFHSRQKEVPFYAEWFKQHGYRIIELSLPAGEFLEGHGDLLWHPDHTRIWAAYGFRSTRGGVEAFANAMKELEFAVTPLHLRDAHCYHLDTCLCALNEEAALIYPRAFAQESLKALRGAWKRVHELAEDEVHHFMGNGIVANGRYLTPHISPHLRKILESEGLQPVMVDTSEFEKSGGSCFCMKAFID